MEVSCQLIFADVENSCFKLFDKIGLNKYKNDTAGAPYKIQRVYEQEETLDTWGTLCFVIT